VDVTSRLRNLRPAVTTSAMKRTERSTTVPRTRNHQLKIWRTESDYRALRRAASMQGETLSAVVRQRLIGADSPLPNGSTLHSGVRGVSSPSRLHRKVR
jgi:hypothetical protein